MSAASESTGFRVIFRGTRVPGWISSCCLCRTDSLSPMSSWGPPPLEAGRRDSFRLQMVQSRACPSLAPFFQRKMYPLAQYFQGGQGCVPQKPDPPRGPLDRGSLGGDKGTWDQIGGGPMVGFTSHWVWVSRKYHNYQVKIFQVNIIVITDSWWIHTPAVIHTFVSYIMGYEYYRCIHATYIMCTLFQCVLCILYTILCTYIINTRYFYIMRILYLIYIAHIYYTMYTFM